MANTSTSERHEYCYASATLTAIQWNGRNINSIIDFLVYIGDIDTTSIKINLSNSIIEITYNGKVTEVPRDSYIILEDGELVELDAKAMEEAMIMVR